MAMSGLAPTVGARMDANWLEPTAGPATLMPVIDAWRAASVRTSRSRHLFCDRRRSPASQRSASAHFLPDRRNARRLQARVRRNHPCIGALSHESYLSPFLEPRQRTMGRRA